MNFVTLKRPWSNFSVMKSQKLKQKSVPYVIFRYLMENNTKALNLLLEYSQAPTTMEELGI